MDPEGSLLVPLRLQNPHELPCPWLVCMSFQNIFVVGIEGNNNFITCRADGLQVSGCDIASNICKCKISHAPLPSLPFAIPKSFVQTPCLGNVDF